ncbi:hypothetical protein [Streptomyces goshikiensis]|uniref:hypothetical protein n=1 Tax=Streptomyces goshikiensis TaxID=1942 RepID=UPI0036C1F003
MDTLTITEPLLTNDPGHLYRPVLCADQQSPWVGQRVTELHRQRGTVLRVYDTPFSDTRNPYSGRVALLANNSGGLILQVTDLLSAPGIPAATRTDYLRNLRCLYRLNIDDDARPETRKAWNRRVNLFIHYDFARRYVEAGLLQQVAAGDHLVYSHGRRVTVIDPEADVSSFTGERRRMRVKVTDPAHDAVYGWQMETDTDGFHMIHLNRDGQGRPLPTLGLI